MWRRHLNSEALVTTTHRKTGEVSDGTGTQVISQMISQTIDKCKVKMIPRELYNVKNPLWKEKGKNSRERIRSLLTIIRRKKSIYIKEKLLGLRVCSHLFLKFNSNLLWTCDNCCPNSLRPNFPTHSLKNYCLRLIGLSYHTFEPQIETLHIYIYIYILCFKHIHNLYKFCYPKIKLWLSHNDY